MHRSTSEATETAAQLEAIAEGVGIASEATETAAQQLLEAIAEEVEIAA